MLGRLVVAIWAIIIAFIGTYLWDEYYSGEALEYFEEAQEDCFRWDIGECPAPEKLSYDTRMYLFAWRILDNCLPSVSALLAPPPDFNGRGKIKLSEVRTQDYYYDSWSGVTIVVDENEINNKIENKDVELKIASVE